MPRYKPLKGFPGLKKPKGFTEKLRKLEAANKKVQKILKAEAAKKQEALKKAKVSKKTR